MNISIRSIQQQEEDELLELHSYLDKELNGTIPSQSLWPEGRARKLAFDWFRQLSLCIESGDLSPIFNRVPRNLMAARYIRYLLLRR